MPDVLYRPFEEDDFRAVADIVGAYWHALPAADEQLLWGALDLATCLHRTTQAQVAVVDGRLAGALLLRVGDVDAAEEARWRDIAEEALGLIREIDPELAKLVTACGNEEQRIDAWLLRESGCDERFEVVLLILAPEARGLGVGCELFSQAEAAFAAAGATDAFLFTDDTCAWGFYERRGLFRAAEYHTPAAQHDLLAATYYLYTIDPTC